MKTKVDKNGIKIIPMLPKTKGVIRTVERKPVCYKIRYYVESRAIEVAASAHDMRGDYEAYECRGSHPKHWHIGHKR